MNQDTKVDLQKRTIRDLVVIGAAVVVAIILELITGAFHSLLIYFENNGSIDPGEVVVVPLALAIGFAVFYYRQFHQLEDAVDAREHAKRQAQDAMMESQEMQRLNQSMVGYGLDVLVRVNEHGEIIQTNEDMEQATGKNGRNLKGTDVFSWFNDPNRVRQLFERAVETGDTVRDDGMEIRHRDGFETPVSTTIVVQQDSEDRVLGGILLCRA